MFILSLVLVSALKALAVANQERGFAVGEGGGANGNKRPVLTVRTILAFDLVVEATETTTAVSAKTVEATMMTEAATVIVSKFLELMVLAEALMLTEAMMLFVFTKFFLMELEFYVVNAGFCAD